MLKKLPLGLKKADTHFGAVPQKKLSPVRESLTLKKSAFRYPNFERCPTICTR